jgi:hypothetical protein
LYAAYRIYSDMAREAILSLSLEAPKSALIYQAAAHEAARRGDTAGAIVDFGQALKINPKLPGLHFELAEMLSSLPSTSAGGVVRSGRAQTSVWEGAAGTWPEPSRRTAPDCGWLTRRSPWNCGTFGISQQSCKSRVNPEGSWSVYVA